MPSGSTFGVIGSNGSGKSTLLKCLAGILVPERGSVTVDGRVSALLELGAGFHPELSGRENVYLNGAILGLSKKETTARFDDIVAFAGLEEFIDTPVKNYSSGMYVRLGFAVAAHVEPEVLLIDEVLSVGDESFQRKCAEKIEQFRQDGRTIVFVSHGLDQVLSSVRTSPGSRRVSCGRSGRRPTSSPRTRARATMPGGSRANRVPLGERRGPDRPCRAARRRRSNRRPC